MSKIKELKNLNSNNINLINLLQELLANKKTKYVDLFSKLITNKGKNEETKDNIFRELYDRFPNLSFNDDLTIVEILCLSALSNWIGEEDINNLNLFTEYNERSLIEKNDITTYKSFEELNLQLSKVELKMIGKDLETQIIKLYDDEEWLIMKPLTFESSKKYGSCTKWCTTSIDNPEHFFRYTRDGILIYCINKKTGYKVAAYKNVKEKDITFWNQKDERIDSFYSELPDELMIVLRKEFKSCEKPNGRLIDMNVREKEIKMYVHKETKVAQLNPTVTERKIKLGNRFEEEMEIEQPPIEQPVMENVPYSENRLIDELENRYRLKSFSGSMDSVGEDRPVVQNEDGYYTVTQRG